MTRGLFSLVNRERKETLSMPWWEVKESLALQACLGPLDQK